MLPKSDAGRAAVQAFSQPRLGTSGVTSVTGRGDSKAATMRRSPRLDFPQPTCVHVENETSNGYILGNSWMRPNFLDLRPSVLLRVLEGKEAHPDRSGVTRFSGDLVVQLLVSEGCEPAAGVIEEHDLLATQDPRGNDEFSEHVVGDGRAAGADDVHIRCLQSQDSLEVREPRVHAGYDRDLGLRTPAQLRIVFLCELFVGLHGLIHKTHHDLLFEHSMEMSAHRVQIV